MSVVERLFVVIILTNLKANRQREWHRCEYEHIREEKQNETTVADTIVHSRICDPDVDLKSWLYNCFVHIISEQHTLIKTKLLLGYMLYLLRMKGDVMHLLTLH